MKYNIKLVISIFLLTFITNSVQSQEYLKEVALNSTNGLYATFITEGHASEKKMVEENAIKSLFHVLIYDGVEGFNDGKRVMQGDCKANLLNSFFNSEARYRNYVNEETEVINKPKKSGTGFYKGTYKVTVKIKQLMFDLKCESKVLPKPRIMVVPFKKNENETYKSILDHDRNMRAAVNEVIRGFNEEDIETQNVSALDKLAKTLDGYTDDVANSNERILLRNADADVYVEVDMEVINENSGKRVSLMLSAYETATGTNWATGTFSSRVSSSNDIASICLETLRRNNNLRGFLDQIENAYSKPTSAFIEIAVSEGSDATLYDRCNNGSRLMENIELWLDDNAYQGEYNSQGGNRESMLFDNVLFPRVDKNGKRMTTNKFAMKLCDDLYKLGADCDFVTEGNKIIIKLLSIE